ncbi:MAG: hypothetical protein JWM35_933 [Verrucomicrobia bacterium]|nr:hypothetical protein [Verrucomicrobiota bacterium]
MITMRLRYFFPVFLVALTGCETSQRARIAEKSAVFESLSLDQQELIKVGSVERGFNGDMVYMALGKPSAIEAGSEHGTAVEVWSYRNYRPGVYGKRKGGGPSNTPESKGTMVFQSLPSEGGAHGDVSLMDNYDRRGSGTPSPPDDGPIFTLRILFVGGKVVSTKLVP